MTATPSRLYRMIEERIDGTLAEYVAARRPGKTWRQIAEEVQAETRIEVSWESLRSWFAGRISYEAKVDAESPVSAA